MAEIESSSADSPDSERRGRDSNSWLVGLALIGLGIVFLLENAGYLTMTENWWALFIYLAAIASLANAWRSYRANGELNSAGTGSLIWGLVLTVVGSIFFFDLQWDTWWPAILVAVGLGMVIGYGLRKSR